MLKSMLSLFGFLLFYSLSAQPTAPSEFPGIQLGVKFTPHHTVLDYFTKEAANNSNRIKLINYGTTNEGRQLIALFISTPENLKYLEEIRLNNLRNAKLINDGKVSSIGKKSIVWLSYNVHGNETSGTEAALNTYYKLMTDKNFDVLLKDLIIIIDPCLNPDGRERYTNWLTSMSGTNADTNPWAREHQEPWPGGRVNHYYFDLNRDWAWQTQVESKARLALYNQWLPQVHVDFHEQSVNNPYYFAPAAEPFHEAITPFQRSFQKTIGTNNAKYFDGKSWLYFTNERFDLFYPSYGDTYPIYTGSIGMTYEQAGGARAGVAVKVDDESILTLKDRIDHHTATGMSTIEVASKNASLLYDEFVKYYSNVMSVSKKDYNTFVLRFNKGDENRFESIKKLMDLNLIQFGSGSGIIKGYDYFSGKSVDYEIKDQDLVIKTQQSRSSLIKVLFEPKSVLSDSVTYDITAWSLPYVYGIDGIASFQQVATTPYSVKKESTPLSENYGYALAWNGGNASRVVAQLLKKKIRLRYSEQPFTINGKSFDRGTILILNDGNRSRAELLNILNEATNNYNVVFTQINGGMVDKGFDMGSGKIRFIKPPRIVLMSGEGSVSYAVGEVWHHLDKELDYPISLVNSSNFANIKFSETDVIILADGNYKFLRDKEMSEILRNWISQGGRLIALEAAVDQLTDLKWINLRKRNTKDTTDKDPYKFLKTYENREKDEISNISPGAIYKVELDNSHPLAFGYPSFYFSLKQSNNFYDYIKESGWNVGVIKADQQIQGFVGSKLIPKFKNSFVFGTQEEGRGQIIFLTDDILFRNFWENGKLMFDNALFLVGQ